ncbi:hypothetical protein POF50_010990 [Streptomyces sp. SL13]|uniref:Uncharacterized protein n=1 Tax=Streptantibioticus silvisoli TaxID=2705255 RepID=A0AA90KG87_9ACTN|nr:hypothetical protein [Streptantibioticus silvisoli]MDI5969854.1 hypothetical protein [Streptantibioticus silvisoli]
MVLSVDGPDQPQERAGGARGQEGWFCRQNDGDRGFFLLLFT